MTSSSPPRPFNARHAEERLGEAQVAAADPAERLMTDSMTAWKSVTF